MYMVHQIDFIQGLGHQCEFLPGASAVCAKQADAEEYNLECI